jgi:8-oxo-dGTP diphosphatase
MPYPLNMRVRASGLVLEDDSILLVEYYAEIPGLHYVLPGGAVQAGETLREAVAREVREESCIEVEVGELVLAYEYAPHKDAIPSGVPPTLTLVFACKPLSGSARLPDCPDADQTGVRWVGLDELDGLALVPDLHKTVLNYVYQGKTKIDWIEEWKG